MAEPGVGEDAEVEGEDGEFQEEEVEGPEEGCDVCWGVLVGLQ